MEYQAPSFSIFFAFLVFILMVIRLWRNSKLNPSISHLPPGPRKLPVIGNIHHLVGSLPHRRLQDLAKKHGPLMHLQLGEISTVVVSSPDIAREVLRTHDLIFAQRPAILAAQILTYGCTDIAFAPYGDYWRQLRKICILELLSAKRVQSFRSIREDEVAKIVRSISSSAGTMINFSKKLYSLTYGIALKAAFGMIFSGEESFIPVVEEILRSSSGFNIADLYPSVKLLHVISGVRPKIERLHQEFDKILESIIKEHRASRAGSKIGSKNAGEDL